MAVILVMVMVVAVDGRRGGWPVANEIVSMSSGGHSKFSNRWMTVAVDDRYGDGCWGV